ncbi:MAG TPA: DUF2911 domain-containing protein [Gemmatimonadales bacterium]|nr:DUF2911 domain-containing protein [Gemmatimonadales bacterium]
MHTISGLAIIALAIPAALPAQTGEFVVRLGRDTLAVERYTRTADRLEGEQVVRSPRTVHRLYTASFGPGGAIQRFELITHNVDGGPGPLERRAIATFSGDSAVMSMPRGDSTTTLRVKTAPGALPFIGQGWGLVEEVARRARAAGSGSYAIAMVQLGDTDPLEVTVTPRGPDSMTIVLGPLGPMRARVDGQGTLLGLSGVGSTMQVTVERVQGLDFAALGKSFASRSLGTLSPPDSLRASVGGAALSVRYSRPSTRGRVIFGNVVPWNQVWRTGANQATILQTSADLTVAGTTVPAGKYSLWTIPSPGGWKLIVNKNTGQWGTDYDAQYDLARLEMKVESLLQPVEQFTIAIEPKGKRGVLKLEWEKTRASIPFSAK